MNRALLTIALIALLNQTNAIAEANRLNVLQATADRDTTQLAQLLAYGADVDSTDANGNTATSITSDTGVLITMGLTSMGQALDNLAAGDVQPVLATDGAELAAGVDADGNLVFRMPDGTEAATADGEAYTADDLTALRLIFSIG